MSNTDKQKMETRNVTIRLGGKVTSTVDADDVTPAEVVVIRTAQRSGQAVLFRKDARTNRIITRKVERTKREELNRLAKKYNVRFLNAAFPGWKTSTLVVPVSFEDIEGAEYAPQVGDEEAIHTIAGDDFPEPGTGEKPE